IVIQHEILQIHPRHIYFLSWPDAHWNNFLGARAPIHPTYPCASGLCTCEHGGGRKNRRPHVKGERQTKIPPLLQSRMSMFPVQCPSLFLFNTEAWKCGGFLHGSES